MTEFQEFAKIFRWSRDLIITEKIDGTNAQVCIERDPYSNGDGERTDDKLGLCIHDEPTGEFYTLRAGSRTRWITPEQDNFAFAKWAYEHARELVHELGEGRHFGEWWGSGVQRGYGITGKRWSLFNVSRWRMPDAEPWDEKQRVVPSCCHVVPTLFRGMNEPGSVEAVLQGLAEFGSHASPGFLKPEGIVIFHVPSGHLFKKTILKDEEPKGRH